MKHTWQLYKDDVGQYRWRRYINGSMIGRAHRGFLTEALARENTTANGRTGRDALIVSTDTKPLKAPKQVKIPPPKIKKPAKKAAARK